VFGSILTSNIRLWYNSGSDRVCSIVDRIEKSSAGNWITSQLSEEHDEEEPSTSRPQRESERDAGLGEVRQGLGENSHRPGLYS
jgi:hypothetical protein